MTKEELIRMAHEASPDLTWYAAIDEPDMASPEELDFLERFAALVAEREREACAKVCETEWSNVAEKMYGLECAAAIRARGQG